MSIVQQRPEAIAETRRIIHKWAAAGILPVARDKPRPPTSHYKLAHDKPPPPPLTPTQRILAVACTMFGIGLNDLRGRGRLVHIVDARQYAAVRLRRELHLSTTRIGWALGGRDHSTICHLLNHRAKRR